jgi:uncharacterized protein with von Willebrand factor type A (vWA) domain
LRPLSFPLRTPLFILMRCDLSASVDERKLISLRLILAAVQQRHRSKIAPWRSPRSERGLP